MDPATVILIVAALGAGLFAVTRRVEAAEPPVTTSSETPPMLPPSLGGIPGVAEAEMFGRLVMQVDWADFGESVERGFNVIFNPGAVVSAEEQIADQQAAWGEAVTNVVANELPNEVFDDFSITQILTAIIRETGYPRGFSLTAREGLTLRESLFAEATSIFGFGGVPEAEAQDLATRILSRDASLGANARWSLFLLGSFSIRKAQSLRAREELS